MSLAREVLANLRDRLALPWTLGSRAARLATWVALGLLLLWMRVDDDAFLGILDSANLAFHEAGHLVYGFFGETAGLYGGTFGQLTFPLVATGIFLWRRQAVPLTITVAWLGQNLVNIARYCADARAQELPLVGGGEHDWTNILGRWHALHRDTQIAGLFRVVGVALVVGAGAWLAWRTWREAREAAAAAPPAPPVNPPRVGG